MSEQCCESCYYSYTSINLYQPTLYCRRYPPILVAELEQVPNPRYPYDGTRYITGSATNWIYPCVNEAAWCGEWKDRD